MIKMILMANINYIYKNSISINIINGVLNLDTFYKKIKVIILIMIYLLLVI